MDKEIIYVCDPCCSWCYGFSPVINEIREDLSDQVPMRLVMGGLRVGDHHVRDQARKDYVRKAWTTVSQMTGQPVSLDVLEKDNMSENTEPPCRAVVVIRNEKPDKVFEFLKAVQKAFFFKNEDITDPDILANYAADIAGMDKDDFLEKFNSEAIKKETQADFDYAKSIGVTGFPTTVLRDGDQLRALSAGYRPLQALKPFLEIWVNR